MSAFLKVNSNGSEDVMNRRSTVVVPVVSALLLAFGFSRRHVAQAASQQMSSQDLHAAMRKLWEDHITYTRNYIIRALADLPDAKAVAKRLLKNQDEIGAA